MLEHDPPAILRFNAMRQFVIAGKPKRNPIKNHVKEIIDIRSYASFKLFSTLGIN